MVDCGDPRRAQACRHIPRRLIRIMTGTKDELNPMMDDQNAENLEQDDPWAAGVGYMMLADLTPDSTVMLSAGPAMEGTFYADVSSFQYTGMGDDGEDSDETKETKDEDRDFRAIADAALRAMEEDYRRTVQGEPAAPSEPDEPLPPIRLLSEDFGPCFFRTSFDEAPADPGFTNEITKSDSRRVPEIDTDAVRRAVGAIRLADTKLTENYNKWEAQQTSKALVPPKNHALIHSKHLASFRRLTPNAVHASSILSRAATIADALVKLDLLKKQDCLLIDVLGCDHVECSSESRLRELFGPLIRWISDHNSCPKDLRLRLIGPNIPQTAPRSIDFHVSGTLLRANLSCQRCVYAEHCRSDMAARLLVAFHAGIWGYDEWRPTLRYLAKLRQRAYFVVTAYTLEEAEDDAEVIQEEVSQEWHVSQDDLVNSACLWPAQMNAFASRQDRETATAAPGRRYRENAAWQAWCF